MAAAFRVSIFLLDGYGKDVFTAAEIGDTRKGSGRPSTAPSLATLLQDGKGGGFVLSVSVPIKGEGDCCGYCLFPFPQVLNKSCLDAASLVIGGREILGADGSMAFHM